MENFYNSFYLQGLTDAQNIQIHHQKQDNQKTRGTNILHYVNCERTCVNVCKKAFIALHAVSECYVQ
jgi:hypothetical protein